MRLGGFVIHGDSAATLADAVSSLSAVCDEVVCIDSESTDGSAAIATSFGAQHLVFPWRGFGAARARAVEALRHCDYIVYLDSDEYLDATGREAVARFRDSAPAAPGYQLEIVNWVDLGNRRFVYNRTPRVRLVRPSFATWNASMLVHESLGMKRAPSSGIQVQHRYASGLPRRRQKDSYYALLWAIQAAAAGKRLKPLWIQKAARFLGDFVFRGAAFRGGWHAARLAWAAADYHAGKYALLRAIQDGKHADLVDLYRRGDYAALFQRLPAAYYGASTAT